MTDHTRIEKIGDDSIVLFLVFQVVAGNRYDSLAMFHMLNLSVMFICVVIMHHLVIYLWHFILLYLNNYGVIYCLLVNKSLHTHSRAFCIT